MSQNNPIVVYTDGGMCERNPGPGGYAAIILKDGKPEKELTGSFSLTTNNRMEISAVVHALEHLVRKGVKRVKIHSDSQYVVNSIQQNWIGSWERQPNFGEKKNEDLWRLVLKLRKQIKIQMVWIRGHAGNKWNEYADELAGEAAHDKDSYEEDLGYLISIGKEPPICGSPTVDNRPNIPMDAFMVDRKLKRMPRSEWDEWATENNIPKRFLKQSCSV